MLENAFCLSLLKLGMYLMRMEIEDCRSDVGHHCRCVLFRELGLAETIQNFAWNLTFFIKSEKIN